MWLSATEIAKLVREGRVGISPFDERLLKPASYVLRLGNECLRWKRRSGPIVLSEYTSENADFDRLPTENAVIEQGNTFLVATLEQVRLGRDLVGVLSTLSHLARMGLNVLNGSSIVSPGFGEHHMTRLTMELVSHNPNPIHLKPGLPICHLAFQTVLGPGTPNRKLSSSIYETVPSPAPPMYLEEFADLLRATDKNPTGTAP